MKQFFERKNISYLCVIIAICIKTLLYLHFFQLEGDKLFQALGAKNLIEGRGLTFQHVSAHDLSSQITEAVNRWPIGYSLVLAPLYWLTGDIEAACVTLDILSICFFFIVLFKILHRLQFKQYLINAIILFNGATFGPYISKPTDLLACAALLYACLLFLIFISGRKSAAFGLIPGSAAVVPVVFRFMYVPCVFVIPILLYWMGHRKKDARMIAGGMYALLSSLIFLGTFLMFQKAVVGNTSYMIALERGFFPENLLMTYPFIVDAYLDTNFVVQQVNALTGISFVFLFKCLQYLNVILLGFLLYKSIAFVINSRATLWKSFDFFLILSGAISGLLLLLLGYLSVTNSSEAVLSRSPFQWTFIGDGRYFLFPEVVLFAITGYWIFNRQWSTFAKFQRPVQYLFFAFIFFQLAHTLYFLGRRFEPLALKEGNVLITRPAQTYLCNRIDAARQEGQNVVFTGTNESVSNWATLKGEKGILHVEEILTAEIRPKKPSIVFVLIERKMLPFVGLKLTEKKFRKENEIDGLIIFSKNY